MQVVLRQDVDNLGLRGEVVNVARGFARNYLLPRGMAELATPGLVRELERRDTNRARHEAKTVDEAQAIATRLEAAELRFNVNAGPTGSLFGSVTATNVADKLWEEQKIRVDRRKLGLNSIKRIGYYTVPLELFADVTVGLRVVVAPEGGELPPEAEFQAAVAAEAEAEAQAQAEQAAAEAEFEEVVAVDAVPAPVAAEAEAETQAQPEQAAAEAEFEEVVAVDTGVAAELEPDPAPDEPVDASVAAELEPEAAPDEPVDASVAAEPEPEAAPDEPVDAGVVAEPEPEPEAAPDEPAPPERQDKPSAEGDAF